METIKPGYSNGKHLTLLINSVHGMTGHAEVIQIDFQPDIISYEVLLEVLLHAHDPTTLNRQGADTGTQYRSGIYFHNEEQQQLAEVVKARLDESDLCLILLSLKSFQPNTLFSGNLSPRLYQESAILIAMP